VSVAARVGLSITILGCVGALVRPEIRSAQKTPSTRSAVAAQWTGVDRNGSVRGEPGEPVEPKEPRDPRDRAETDDGTVDLYGNQVSDAVAKYELDATGGLYELHSPQTELPRLKSPKS
jgi:hypothetical protein